ncbi:uncharacterized protein LOC122252640 [Penaeus japonicus]|uniref:uncharacterized protein LOC122252640 n=1 Tax=Penaeus japonicus TaxID=27405 RepID=UPI001C70B46E|nr:uncharacterized protein LOC122252640 [Penaeus japonicus]
MRGTMCDLYVLWFLIAMILALGTEGQTIWASEPRITMPILNNNPAFGWLLVPQPPGSGIAAGWPMGFESGGGVWPMNTVVEEPSFITPKAGRFLDSNSADSRLDLVGPVSSKPAGDGSVNFEPVKSKPIDFQPALKAKPAVGGMPESKPGNESRSRVSVDDGAAKALQPESMPGHGRADSKSVNDTEDGPLLDSIKKDKEKPKVRTSSICENSNFIAIPKDLLTKKTLMILMPWGSHENSSHQTNLCNDAPPRNCFTKMDPSCSAASHKYRSFDGSCNNLLLPSRGKSGTSYGRYLRPEYEDGNSTMRGGSEGGSLPSPRRVSEFLQTVGPGPQSDWVSLPSLLVSAWTQLVSEDMSIAPVSQGGGACCSDQTKPPPPAGPEADCQPMDVSNDAFFRYANMTCLPFVRSQASQLKCPGGHREQVNMATHYLDASGIYGSSNLEAKKLRTFHGGEVLAIKKKKQQLEELTKPGGNSSSGLVTPTLAAMHQLFLRIHNSLARQLSVLNPHWDDDTLFQEARRLVVAMIQHVSYVEYLPMVLGQYARVLRLSHVTSGYSSTYSPEVDVTVANVFGAAAFRFVHSMITESFRVGPFSDLKLIDSFKSVKASESGATSLFLKGLADSPAAPADHYFTPTLHNGFGSSPADPVGSDLYAIDIQRGRDHGLPGYSEWRRACGLPPITRFSQLSQVMPHRLALMFRQLYRKVEDLDLFPAGLAEHKFPEGLVGPTFACIIGGQFLHTRRGDRFWYENDVLVRPFTPAQLRSVHRLSLASILCYLGDLKDMQMNPFLFLGSFRNPVIPCSSYPRLNLEPWREPKPHSLEPQPLPTPPHLPLSYPFPTYPFLYLSPIPSDYLYPPSSPSYKFPSFPSLPASDSPSEFDMSPQFKSDFGPRNMSGGSTSPSEEPLSVPVSDMSVMSGSKYFDSLMPKPWSLPESVSGTEAMPTRMSEPTDPDALSFQSMPDSSFQSMPDSSFQSMPDSSFQSMPDSSFQSMPDSSFQSMPDSSFQSMLDSSFQSMPDSSFQAIPEPLPQPMPEPLPQTMPEPLLQTMPGSLPQPMPEPLSQTMPEPLLQTMPGSLPQPMPEPLSQTMPEPLLQTMPGSLPQPMPEPLPQPMPESLPQPMPEPLPQPMPEPLPQPMPGSFPQPMPDSFPQPMPDSFPQPMPDSFPQPIPETLLYPMPESLVQPKLLSLPQPMPYPVPEILFQPIPEASPTATYYTSDAPVNLAMPNTPP